MTGEQRATRRIRYHLIQIASETLYEYDREALDIYYEAVEAMAYAIGWNPDDIRQMYEQLRQTVPPEQRRRLAIGS